MTPEEQQQVNAAYAYFERQCGNLAREGANAMALAEGLAIRVKALEAELAALKKPAEGAPKLEAVPKPCATGQTC